MKGKRKRGKLRIHLAQIRATVGPLSLLPLPFLFLPSMYLFITAACSPQYTCPWPPSVPFNIPVHDRRLFPSIYLFMTVVCSFSILVHVHRLFPSIYLFLTVVCFPQNTCPQYTCSLPSFVPLNIPVHDHRLFPSIYLFMTIVCSPTIYLFMTILCSPVSILCVTNRTGVPAAVSTEDYKQ